MTTRTEYLASAVILWVAIWIATEGTLDESAFDDMIPILGGGTFFFVGHPAGGALPPVARVTDEADVRRAWTRRGGVLLDWATTSGPIAGATPLHPPGDSAVDVVGQSHRGDRPLSNSVAPPSEATVAIERLCARSGLSTHASSKPAPAGRHAKRQ